MSLLIRLRENKDFTSSEEYVAKFIMENYNKIKNMDAKTIAKETYTSISAVTRMCKKIGLSGFSEFKILLIEEISTGKDSEIQFENVEIERNNDTEMIIEKLNLLSISSLKETKVLQDPQMIDKVVKLINEKQIIDLYGIGASYIVCLDAQYKFMRVGKGVNLFHGTDQQHIQAINSDKNHLAILISYSGMTKEMVEIAKILSKKGIETVSITQYSNNFVAKECKYNLYVTSREKLKRSAAIYSRISMLNLIDVLYLKYSNMNYDLVKQKIYETKIKKIEKNN